jgi:UDP-N-acetylmuramoyl-tripeptide--D-alanyl-D-alanine ligase
VNGDDPHVAAIPLPAGVRRVTYGARGEIVLLDAEIDAADLATRARIRTPVGEVEVHLPSPGRHIAHDALAAIAAATALGIDPYAAAAALARYEPVGMRLRRETLPGGVVVLNDAYNANPDSMKASLAVLAALGGRKVAVIGDMLELGPDETSWHREIATHARGLGLDLLILVGPRMAGALPAEGNVWTFAEPDDAVPPLASWLRAGDTVLLKGSRGARVERILQGLRSR